jgi:fatty-acyl-CoA synthase
VKEVKTNPDLSYCHGVGVQSLIGRTLSEQFDLIAAGRAKSEALVCSWQKIRWTYEQLSERVDLFARGLLKLGIEVGDRVGIWSTNNVEWIVVQLATAKIGAILVNINPAYRTSELDYALRQSGVKMLVAMRGYKSDEYLAMLYELAPELMNSEVENPSPRLPDLRYIVVIDGRSVEQSESVINFDLLYDYGQKIPAQELSFRSAALQFDSPINIQYTSGTTGFPKGVTLTHHNLLNNALYSAHAMGVNETSRFCVPMPFYHCGGMVLCTLVTLLVGGTLVIPNPTFDPGATLQVVAKEKCTHLSGVPTMFVSELDLSNFNDFDLSSLEGGFMAGAPCPVELMHQVTGRLHCSKLVIFYGQTECSPVITSTTVDDSLEVRATTVGRVIPHLEVKVVDSLTGAVLPRGQQGEICARGYAVMPGYWMNPAATEESVDSSGWLHTGDLAVMSAEGLINITGRKKDMIIRGGENIYPREIEEVLHGHPEVAQAQVFGVPDKHFGEEVALWVQLKQDCHADGEQLRSWLKERVAHFKIPKYIKVVSEFPMTVTGKVQKHAMRDVMITELGLEAAAGIRTA